MNKPDWVLEPASGLVRGLSYLESPHCDERPAGCAPDLLVIHAISLPEGEFGGDDVTDLFLGCLDVSSHPDYAGLQDLQVAATIFLSSVTDRYCNLCQYTGGPGMPVFLSTAAGAGSMISLSG